MAFSFLGISAQGKHPIYLWHNNGIHMEMSDDVDSITFILPDDLFILTTGDAVIFTDSTMYSKHIVTPKANIIPEWWGVCYSHKTNNPTLKDELIWSPWNSWFNKGAPTEVGTTLEGLIPGTTYYYRPYVIYDNEILYGEVKNFTTLGQKPEPCDSLVDLGLSVKWAACNLGAEQPYEFGDYYAWGETERKDLYTDDNYKFGRDSVFSKYGSDNKVSLDPEDDAATVILGYPYRMPDINEINELNNKCTWTSSSLHGISGVKITGPNGNSIFLPFCHKRYRNPWNYADSYRFGHIWSSTRVGNQAFRLSYDDYCGFRSLRNNYLAKSNRCLGICIRPVKP